MFHPRRPKATRRNALVALCACLGGAWDGVLAQTPTGFPTRPITMVVPYSAGGISDVYARIVGQAMSVDLGQPVVVENRAGASGAIAAQSVLRAPADGYTLMMGGMSSLALAPMSMSPVPFDAERDFAPVGMIGTATYVLLSSLKFGSLKELVAAAQAAPGKLSIGTVGEGTVFDLGARMIDKVTGVQLLRVPYKGLAPALQDFNGGVLDMVMSAPDGNVVPTPRSHPLAVLAAKRLTAYPDIPTTAELGYPDLTLQSWTGFFVASKTPPELTRRLARAMDKAMQLPEVRSKLSAAGIEPSASDPAGMTQLLKRDIQRARELMASR